MQSVSGHGGESGSLHNTQWAATPGGMWQGGSGCEFGGGGMNYFISMYVCTYGVSV